ANAELLRALIDGGGVLTQVPEDVRGHERGDAGVPVDLRGIFQLLEDGHGGAGLREDAEPGAGVGVAPGRRFDLLRLQPRLHPLDVHAPALKPFDQAVIVVTIVVRHSIALPGWWGV